MRINPAHLAGANDPAPDSEYVRRRLAQTADGPLDLIAVFGATSFEVYHVSESMREDHEDEEALVRHLSSLAETVRGEFVEHGLVADLTLARDRLEYRTDEHDGRKLVKVYCGGRGMLLGVDPEEPVEPLAEVAFELLGRGPGP